MPNIEPIVDRMAAVAGALTPEEQALLNINTADIKGFMTLPNMTSELARNIIDYRESLGGSFDTLDDFFTYLPVKKHKKEWEPLVTTKNEEEE